MIFKSLQRTVGHWLPQDSRSRILDVGCGEGNLLAFLRSRGYDNLHGFDISEENVSICHRLGLDFVTQYDALQIGQLPTAEPFHVVFALDLIEHLPKQEAATFLEQVRHRLAPGGSLILQTPNMGSVLGHYYRYTDLSHDFGLTERSATSLLLIAGFELNDIEIRPAFTAATLLGRMREYYVKMLHSIVFLSEGTGRPVIPTKNLLIRAHVPT